MTKCKRLLPLIVLMVLLTPLYAGAITFNFTGIIDKGVTDHTGVLGGDINLGDTFSGSFSYDLTTPDTNPMASVGGYQHNSGPYGISVDITSHNFRTDPADVNLKAEVANDHSTAADIFALISYNNIGADEIYWQLDDPTMTAVTDTALPTSFNLASWSQPFGLHIAGGVTVATAADPYFLIAGTVTSITPASVPEPATLLLLGSGLFGIGGLGLARRKFKC